MTLPLLFSVLLVAGQDQAPAPPAPGLSRTVEVTVGASLNPPGLQGRTDVEWRRPTTRSANPLLSDAHIAFGLSHSLSPSYTRAGVWVEASPLSILDVRAGIEPSYYFGTFGSLMSFAGYDQDFAWDAVQSRSAAAVPAATVRAYVKPTAKMKAGPLVAAWSGEFERWTSNAPGPLFYEPWRDTLVRASGQTIASTQILVLVQMGRDRRLSIGGVHAWQYAAGAPENDVQRVGPLVIYEPTGHVLGLPAPRIVVTASRYLSDPNKQGGYYAAVGVTVRLGR